MSLGKQLVDNMPFGELLQQFRVRARLSQMALANELGVHRNTIVSWEHGNYLPKMRGIVTEIARALYLTVEEEAALLNAALFENPSSIWGVPYRRNPFFTGREDILQQLHGTLRIGSGAALTQPQA